MQAVLSHPLVLAADRYAEQVQPARRARRAHAVSKLVAAYVTRPEVVAAAALQEVAPYCAFDELRARFGEPTARLVAEIQPGGCGSRKGEGNSTRAALKTRRLQRLSPEAQSIRLATLIQRTMRLLERPLTLARVGLAQTCAELAALERAHPVLQSIARKLCGAASRRLGAVQGA
ncbi:hypothetical protein [Azohydromonas caseinilytica]|uniref:Uncharacterized protein n=1 Tax=Azohydromonas caseinilytica TaxID=2728836 RepID=A0A848FFY0_9BURK|nr:hypothetical protein [Azohydromonas caseinilytica]NML18348.1 hypothetical protein [Azohydromonas caseinilytica]